jgi:hypothetical protein
MRFFNKLGGYFGYLPLNNSRSCTERGWAILAGNLPEAHNYPHSYSVIDTIYTVIIG